MHAALLVVQLLFVGNAIVGKIALRTVSPATVLAVRAPVAALLFLCLRWLIARRAGWERVERRDLWRLAGAGLLGISLNQLLFFEGLSRSTATNATVISACIPVFTTGLSIALRNERATPRKVLGLLLALSGALVVVLLGRSRSGFHVELGMGELLLFGNATAYSLYLVVSRPLFRRYRTDVAVTWIFAFGAAALLPLGLMPLVHELPSAPPTAYVALAFIVLGPTVGAYFLNGFALKRAPASLVAVYIYVQPIVAAFVAAHYLDEQLTPATIGGGVLIGCGIALVALRRAPS